MTHISSTGLRVGLNAQFVPHQGGGGFETVCAGLVRALGQLSDGKEEYVVIVPAEGHDVWKGYLGPNQRLRSVEETVPQNAPFSATIVERLRSSIRAIRQALLPTSGPHWPSVPISDGFFESLGCDVMHFPYHDFVLCAIPSIYNPHDLQHRHFPQFFSPSTLAWRETIYPAACRLCNTVAVASQWVRDDIVQQYSIDPHKIQVIPWAAPTNCYSAPTDELSREVKSKFQLPQRFVLYPAMTYEHKNHLRLIDAVALLRDNRGLRIGLVCTGAKKDHWLQINERLTSHKLTNQVNFVGMVSPNELRALYRLCEFVIVPSLFEAASAPVFEAWQDAAPVACSRITSLPEQVRAAALLFNPFHVEEIADTLQKMWLDASLREELRRLGMLRLQDFSWERTAKAYRALYRRIAGRTLTEEDCWLLAWDWMRDPSRCVEERV